MSTHCESGTFLPGFIRLIAPQVARVLWLTVGASCSGTNIRLKHELGKLGRIIKTLGTLKRVDNSQLIRCVERPALRMIRGPWVEKSRALASDSESNVKVRSLRISIKASANPSD